MVAETQRRLSGQLRQEDGQQRRIAEGVAGGIAADAAEQAQRTVVRLRAQAPIMMAGDADGVAVNPDAQRRGTAVAEQAQDKGGNDDQRQQGEDEAVGGVAPSKYGADEEEGGEDKTFRQMLGAGTQRGGDDDVHDGFSGRRIQPFQTEIIRCWLV